MSSEMKQLEDAMEELEQSAKEAQKLIEKSYKLSRAASYSCIVGGMIGFAGYPSTDEEEKLLLDHAETLLNRINARVGL